MLSSKIFSGARSLATGIFETPASSKRTVVTVAIAVFSLFVGILCAAWLKMPDAQILAFPAFLATSIAYEALASRFGWARLHWARLDDLTVITQRFPDRKTQAAGFFGTAALSAGLFFAALHPWSSGFGGLVYFLIGGALPALLVIGLALGLAWSVPAPVWVRLTRALALSFVLAVNTKLPVVPDLLHYSPKVWWANKRAVDLSRLKQIEIKRRHWAPVFTRPLDAEVRLASDEGCMCFYFLDAPHNLYGDRLASLLSDAFYHHVDAVDYGTRSDPSSESRDTHLDLNIYAKGEMLVAVVELYDAGEKVGILEHAGIPKHALGDPHGVGRDRFGMSFWRNATDLLLHDNAWIRLLDRFLPDYFSYRDMRTFFKRAAGEG